MVGRSPSQLQGIRSARRRLNEEDLGDIFNNISKVMRKEIVSGGQHSKGIAGRDEGWDGSDGQGCGGGDEQD